MEIQRTNALNVHRAIRLFLRVTEATESLENITNMFSVANTHQSPLDEPFFTFSAMLQHANATPKPCTPKDNDRLFDNSFFNELQESNTISMEEILPFETYNQAGSCDDYDYSLDLFNSASLHGMFDTADAYVTKPSPLNYFLADRRRANQAYGMERNGAECVLQ